MSKRAISVLTSNQNVKSDLNDWDTNLKNIEYTGGLIKAGKSEFK